MKKVKIENAGCAIFPSGSLYNVRENNDVSFWANSDVLKQASVEERILIKDWCKDIDPNIETITDEHGNFYPVGTLLFGKEKYEKGISLNKFYNEGYYHNTEKTGKFSDDEYEIFENYILENEDKLFIGTCDYSSFIKLVNSLKQNSFMMHEDDIDELFKEMIEEEKKQQKNWESIKDKMKPLIHEKYFDFIESMDSYYDEGIVNIKETDEKQPGYGDKQRNCRIIGQEIEGLYMHTTNEVEYNYGVDGKYEGESVEYWVNQWSTGMEGDSFSGNLLFLLNDGSYWKVGYSC